MIGVRRPREIPRSLTELTTQNRYRNDDVVEALAETFHDKCYICEQRPVSDPEVEHLRPHKGGERQDRKFDWNNLFYVCHHCNTVKNKPRYEEGIIDCCVRDPEQLLSQELVDDEVHVAPLAEHDDEAGLTAELIEEVFMTDHPRLRSKASSVRLKELQITMNVLYTKLADYRSGEDCRAEDTIAAMLRPEARYAGFTRHFVRTHIDAYPRLRRYLTSPLGQ